MEPPGWLPIWKGKLLDGLLLWQTGVVHLHCPFTSCPEFGTTAALTAFPSHPPPPDARRASDKCQRERRKTVNGDDLIWAMTTLGFDDYVEVRPCFLGGLPCCGGCCHQLLGFDDWPAAGL